MVSRTLLAGLLLTATASACGNESPEDEPPAAPYSLPVHTADIPLDQVSWAHAGNLHLGKRTINLGREVRQFVLTPHAIVFVDARGALWSSDGTAPPARVADVGPTRLVVSPDRSRLGFIDFEHGPPDRDGDSKAQVVVFDTTTGKQLIRDSRHISDSADVGQAELFEGALPEVVGFEGDAVYAGHPTTPSLFALDGSKPQEIDGLDDPVFPGPSSYGRPLYLIKEGGRWKEPPPDSPEASDLGVESPEGHLVVLSYPDAVGALVVDLATGKPRPMDLRAEQFVVGGWQSGSRFYGFARAAGVGTGRLVSCDAATGRCQSLGRQSKPIDIEAIGFDDNGASLD